MNDSDDDMEFASEEPKLHDPKRHARAQHNALERRRRDSIKDMYSYLRETVPDIQNERASRAMILRKAIEVIEEKQSLLMQKKTRLAAIEAENLELEQKIRDVLTAGREADGSATASAPQSDTQTSDRREPE